ncbi:MAG: ATP-binding protein [Acidimicrobiia bacterium]|nr:ATP-binding protein [Acidimicrobiia bacterium]
MVPCGCTGQHDPRRIVLTGGPGAGKTAVLELIRHGFCEHVVVLPESAGMLFGGGFPRNSHDVVRRAGQRAIYHVQRELEESAIAREPAIVLCDRGTIDGVAYWPGPGDFWEELGTTLDRELARYHAVIHLRTPPDSDYNHANPLRLETAREARVIDERIARAWQTHPRRFEIGAEEDFLDKAARALALIRVELPDCCRAHVDQASMMPRTNIAAPSTASTTATTRRNERSGMRTSRR